jgi:hypothetical protein
VFVGGIDDPRRMGVDNSLFFENTIDQVLLDTNDDDFILLMSHRPDAFDYAAGRGVNVMFAGHTHGGQIGLLGRSLFQEVWTDSYFWGYYDLGASRLHVSAGMGHWFPFRLGCPPEAPIIELRGK